MNSLNLTIPNTKQALYLRVAESIRQAIKNGLLKPNEKMPSARNLAKELLCHRHTILAAYNELVSEGWISGFERKAYRVSDEIPDSFFKAKTVNRPETSKKMEYRIVRNATITKPEPADDTRYAFLSGMPDLRLFPMDQLRSCLLDSLKRSGSDILGYNNPFGHDQLIIEIEKYLRRVRNIKDRKIIVTNGSQEGIFITAQLFLNPGDVVLVEELGYPPAWEALKSTGATLIGLPVDENGIDIDYMRKILKRRKVRLIYTTPLHQYPTTATMPIPRRIELYKLAAQYNIPILEDDYDHEFHYRSQPLAPLASEDPNGLIIYVSTFSKVLFPSARCGFMAVPEKLFRSISDYKRIISRQNDSIIQDAIARWMREGGFERHMRKMRRNYEERRNTMVEILNEYELDFNLPDGGMAIWANTKLNSTKLAAKAKDKKVYITPENYFRLDGKDGKHLRLGFANQSVDEIKKGLKLIRSLFR